MRRFRRLRHIVLITLATSMGSGIARAERTPAQPASAQPVLPKAVPGGMPLTSPILGGGSSERPSRPLVVRKHAERVAHVGRRHHYVLHARYAPLERPALAGVQLLAPIPHPIQPPHFTVPVPAYPGENFITFFTTPPPPVVCHRAPRDPYAPDPHLVYEKPVVCEADNP